MWQMFFDAVISWLSHGLWASASVWQVVIVTVLMTHVTIVSVTIFLHRAQAHRALDLHALPSHFFRFWLWLTTGMVTKEFVAVHRKHHAKCETEDDPHSPQTRGIKALLLTGVELYRAAATEMTTKLWDKAAAVTELAHYSVGTPNDWIERHLYTRFSWQGVGVMLILDLAVFGALGLTVWAVQMLWIPVMATGIINGIGHYWGYRNADIPDASRNITPWGIVIGGEELHNNHHTYPTSAKFSVKPLEFDIGWLYICAMEMVGLATVKKLPPEVIIDHGAEPYDIEALHAIQAARYAVLAYFDRVASGACLAKADHWRNELAKLWEDKGTNADQLLAKFRAWGESIITAEPQLTDFVRTISRYRLQHTRG